MTIGLMELAIRAALESVPRDERYSGTIELALTYARAVDSGSATIEKVGPMLLSTLDALLLTPRAVAAVEKGMKNGAASAPVSPLDELKRRRDERSARAHGTEALDSATS